jgi:adenosylhomocysteine nucleosidase
MYLAMGMGREMVETKLAMFLQQKRPQMLILTGFAGGLQPELQSGDLILAEEILRPGAEEIRADEQLFAEAEEALSDIRQGRLLTVARPASSEEKNRLGKDFQAMAVDMESWWAVALAREAGVPFLCLKAILDPLDKPLPRFIAGVGPTGRPTSEAWLTLLGHPQELPELLRWARAAHRVSEALAPALSRLVEHFGVA